MLADFPNTLGRFHRTSWRRRNKPVCKIHIEDPVPVPPPGIVPIDRVRESLDVMEYSVDSSSASPSAVPPSGGTPPMATKISSNKIGFERGGGGPGPGPAGPKPTKKG